MLHCSPPHPTTPALSTRKEVRALFVADDMTPNVYLYVPWLPVWDTFQLYEGKERSASDIGLSQEIMMSHGLFEDVVSATSSDTLSSGKGQGALFKEDAPRPQRESPTKGDDNHVSFSITPLCLRDMDAFLFRCFIIKNSSISSCSQIVVT